MKEERTHGCNSSANDPHHEEDEEGDAFRGEGVDTPMVKALVDCDNSVVGLGLRPKQEGHVALHDSRKY